MTERIVLKTFRKDPPAKLVEKLNEKLPPFHGVSNPRVEGREVVCDHFSGHYTHNGNAVMIMIEGLCEGFEAALPPCKPYSITYNVYKLRRGYDQKEMEHIRNDLGLYRSDEIPVTAICYKKSTVVEEFETYDAADKRLDEIFKLWEAEWDKLRDDDLVPVRHDRSLERPKFNEEKSYHF